MGSFNINSENKPLYDIDGILNNEYRRGNYVNINGNNYLIQCPSEINENTSIYIAGRGSDSIGDTYSTFDAARNSNVIVIAPTGEKGFEALNGVVDSLSSAVGISDPQVTFSGHSAYGNAAFKAAANYAKTHNAPTTLVLNDPSTYNHWSDKGIDYEALNGSLIVATAPKRGGCTDDYIDRLQKAAQNGASVLIVRYSQGDHGDSDEVAASLGTYNLSHLKLLSSGKYNNAYNREISTGYSYQWIDENGKIHNFESAEDAQKYINDAIVGINKSLYERCDNLSDFSALYQGGGDTLASNLSYVNNSMSELRSQIGEHQDLNYTKESDNEANIVGAMYNVTNYYGTVTNLLYGNLNAEAEAVYGIANAIYQMDGFSSVMAESTLSDGVSTLFSSSNPTVAEQLENLKAATAGLYDNAKNAVMAGGRYDELSNILGKNVQSGGVGKISVSSLESAIKAIVPALGSEVDRAKALNSSVTDFMSGIGASNVLQGQVWEDVKTNMANYQNLLDANVKAATFIEDSVLTAMGMVSDYIQGAGDKIAAVGALADYGGLATSISELDDSKLPELTSALSEMQAKINETESQINKMEASKHMVADGYTDKDGNFVQTGEHQEPPEAEIQAYRDKLAEYVEIKATLDAYREVLEGLAPVVQAAQDIINDAVGQVKAMYENPVQDTDGNLTFNADFNLDLSPYSEYIDVAKDYKGLIQDYYNKLNSPAEEEPILNPSADTETGTPEAGSPDNGTPGNDNPGTGSGGGGHGGGNNGGGNNGGGNNGGGNNKPEPKTTPEVKTEVPEKNTEVNTSMPYDPGEENDNLYPWDGDDEIIVIPEDPDKVVNLPFIYDENNKPQIINLDAELGNDVPSNNAVIEEPALGNEYTEIVYEKPQPHIVNLASTSTPSPVVQEQSKSLKTMGIASGLGVALGAASLGAHAMIKNKDEEDEKEDYGYNK